jgi:hypothetical protein
MNSYGKGAVKKADQPRRHLGNRTGPLSGPQIPKFS